MTVESIRTARGRKRFSRVALQISARVSCDTISGPIRRVSFLTVDSSGTRSLKEIRQNRRRWIESDTSATSVRYPHRYRCFKTIRRTKLSIAIVGRPSLNTARRVCSTSRRKCSTIRPSNCGSDNKRSSAARSSGSSLTSTGKASSHNDSA